jgi:hypothetical protein
MISQRLAERSAANKFPLFYGLRIANWLREVNERLEKAGDEVLRWEGGSSRRRRTRSLRGDLKGGLNDFRYRFLVNPRARSGKAVERLKEALARPAGPALQGEIAIVRTRDDMRRHLEALSPDEVPVACGGDV